jgi:hypothetical protein
MENLLSRRPAHPVILRIAGTDLVVPAYLWVSLEGPHPRPADFLASDGCSHAPDVLRYLMRLFGRKRPILLFPACWVHDAQYRRIRGADLGGTWTARRRADWILARNLFRLCRLQGVSRTGATIIATTYWTAVRMYGALSYAFDASEEPLGRIQRWREVAMLFRSGAYFD